MSCRNTRAIIRACGLSRSWRFFWPRPLLNMIDKGALEIHRLVDKPGRAQIAAAIRPSCDSLAQGDADEK